MKLIFNLILLSLFAVLTTFSQAQTWYKANNPFGGNILRIHEAYDGTLLCGTTRGLYKSTDQGENWESISGGSDNLPFLDVNSTSTGEYYTLRFYTLQHSSDGGQTWQTIPAQNWTTLNRIIIKDDSLIFLNTNTSVWRSSDGGSSWAQLPIDNRTNSLASLELSPDGELFAGTFNSKIFRSDDNGDTWTELYTPPRDIRSFAFAGSDTVYAGTAFSGIFRSADNGANWTSLTAIPGNDGALDLAANNAGEIFAAAYDGGILKSSDAGMTWSDITSDLIDLEVRKIFPASGGALFLGTQSGGVQKLNGASWEAKNQGISAIYIERFIGIDSLLYACTGSGVFISEDGGISWRQTLKGMDDPDILALAKAPNGDLYAGGEMLYRSTDGVNWTDISQGFPNSEVTATDILIEPNGRVVLATDDYGIRYSDDQGQTWSNANGGLEDVTMAFIRQNASGFYFTADGYNLYRSNDLTGNWAKINTGLTDTDITEFGVVNGTLFAITYSDGLFKSTDNGDTWTLAIDQDFNNVAINGNEVYGASERVTGGGVYFSNDNGATWNNIVNGLPNVQIEEVSYVAGKGLFANVREYGLYTLNFSVLGRDEALAAPAIHTCFPNPFGLATTLRLELKEPAEVNYTIYSVQGKSIMQSPRRVLPPGMHELPVGKNLLPGVYILVVNQGSLSASTRLIKTP